MVPLGFEPGAAGEEAWKAQMNPISFKNKRFYTIKVRV